MKGFKISVVIPVKNGAATLAKCLQSLRNQTIGKQLELIIADSNSTDESREIAMQFGAQIIDIPEGTFDHGLTRNLGVQYASGEFIFFTVQDAWLSNNNLLEKMAEHFTDPEVMGVVGHQAIPHEKDKNPVLWYRPISAPSVTVKKINDLSQFKAMPQHEQQALVGWDNVIAMYRRTALVEQPFVKTAFAEDWIWSYNALLKGWKLLHDSSLVIYHYHHQLFGYSFNAQYTVNYHFYKFFGYKPSLPATIIPSLKIYYHLLSNKNLTLNEKFYWSIHNSSARFAGFLATLNFMIRLKIFGPVSIEKGYKKYCREIPQGTQK